MVANFYFSCTGSNFLSHTKRIYHEHVTSKIMTPCAKVARATFEPLAHFYNQRVTTFGKDGGSKHGSTSMSHLFLARATGSNFLSHTKRIYHEHVTSKIMTPCTKVARATFEPLARFYNQRVTTFEKGGGSKHGSTSMSHLFLARATGSNFLSHTSHIDFQVVTTRATAEYVFLARATFEPLAHLYNKGVTTFNKGSGSKHEPFWLGTYHCAAGILCMYPNETLRPKNHETPLFFKNSKLPITSPFLLSTFFIP